MNLELESLGGFTPEVGVELLGAVYNAALKAKETKAPADIAKARAAMQRINAHRMNTTANDSRSEMLRRTDQLPKHIQEALASRRMQISDHTIYTHFVPGAKTGFNVFKTDSALAHGVTNIAQAQLQKDQVFLLTGIAITAGTYTTGLTDLTEQISSAEFLPLSNSTLKTVAAGEFNLSCNGKQLLPERTPLSKWKVAQQTANSEQTGYVKIGNPKMMEDQKIIKMDFNFPAALLDRCIIRVELIGATVLEY